MENAKRGRRGVRDIKRPGKVSQKKFKYFPD